MTPPPSDPQLAVVRRRGGRLLRVLVLLSFLAGLGVGALGLWEEFVDPVMRPIAREYLGFRRVERYQVELQYAAQESGVDPHLLAAMMFVESGGRLDARSSKEAMGLFQVTQVTADWRANQLGLPPPTEEELLSDALLNARLGADNMAWLLDTYDGNVERALIAYNTGARRLANYVRAAGSWEAWRAEREAAGNSQLLGYANRVLRYRDEFRERGLFEDTNDGVLAKEP